MDMRLARLDETDGRGAPTAVVGGCCLLSASAFCHIEPLTTDAAGGAAAAEIGLVDTPGGGGGRSGSSNAAARSAAGRWNILLLVD